MVISKLDFGLPKAKPIPSSSLIFGAEVANYR